MSKYENVREHQENLHVCQSPSCGRPSVWVGTWNDPTNNYWHNETIAFCEECIDILEREAMFLYPVKIQDYQKNLAEFDKEWGIQ